MPRPSGKVNLIAVLIIAGLMVGVYWLIFFMPRYLENLDVKEATEVAFNESSRTSDDALVEMIALKVSNVGMHREADESGQLVEVPGIGLGPENITVQRDEAKHEIAITVRYVREVRLVPTQNWQKMNFSFTKEGPIPSPMPR